MQLSCWLPILKNPAKAQREIGRAEINVEPVHKKNTVQVIKDRSNCGQRDWPNYALIKHEPEPLGRI